MDDLYALILEGIIHEMKQIAAGEVTSTDRLETYVTDAKSVLNAPNKAALTRALNTTKRYLASSQDEKSEYLKDLLQSIRAVANRYTSYVLNVL